MKSFIKNNWAYILSGVAIGLVAFALTLMGNPANMGFCIACFLRDISGSVGLHGAKVVQYVRPEIIGIVMGAFAISLLKRDFKPTAGSAPALRFVLGAMVMIGALAFLGCPLRMVLRIGGGDLNALVALLGFVAGIGVGVIFLNNGFSLGRSFDQPKAEGVVAPVISLLLLFASIFFTALFLISETGPGSMHAPIWAALVAGLIVGIIGQRTRVCFAGGIRDAMMFKQFHMVWCLLSIIITTLVANLIKAQVTGTPMNFSFDGQPVAHSDHLWSIVGLFIVGLASVFLGGCPFRQLVLAGSGSGDSMVTVLGMIVGAALSHNFGLAGAAANATSAGGVSDVGAIFLCVCVVFLFVIGFFCRRKA